MKYKLFIISLAIITALCSCTLPSGYTQTPEKPSPSSSEPSAQKAASDIPASGLLTAGLKAHTIDSPQITGGLVSAMSDFSIELFKRCAKDGENVVLSPASAYTALGMAAVGAEGNTLKQFEKLLGSGKSLPETLTAYRALLDALTKDAGNTAVSFANSIWVDTARVTVNKSFLQDNVDWFNADVFSEDFSDKATVDAINAWVSDRTKNRIDRLVEEIDQDVIMYLINAVSFDAKWGIPFEEAYEGKFNAPGGKLDTELMDVAGSFGVVESGEFQGVVLPYDDGVYSLLAFMPKKSKPIEDVINKLNAETIPMLLESRELSSCKVTLPKFKTESTLPLETVLIDMGLADAFDGNAASFGKLGAAQGQSIYIGDVLQKAYISVDEAGTEAAAATSVTMRTTGAVINPEEIVFNRPFVYAVVENETGIPLFIGALNNPSD